MIRINLLLFYFFNFFQSFTHHTFNGKSYNQIIINKTKIQFFENCPVNESNNLSTNFVFSGEQSPKKFGWCEGGQQGDSCHPGGSHVLSLPATVCGGGTAGRSREEGLADGSPQVRKVRQSLTTISYIYIPVLAMRTKTTSWPLVHNKKIRCMITRDAPSPLPTWFRIGPMQNSLLCIWKLTWVNYLNYKMYIPSTSLSFNSGAYFWCYISCVFSFCLIFNVSTGWYRLYWDFQMVIDYIHTLNQLGSL